jgi:pimeloyl-ACP methyl ester carboxylesterase
MSDPRPDLRWTSRPAEAEAVVLVLHGGAARSRRENRWLHLPVLRLLPVANAVARAGRGRVAVARLRFAIRGWNGVEESPVADARWGLEQVRAAYPGLPIGVIGHSMGGRVAIRVAGDPGVRAVVGLASWVERGDVAQGRPGVSALLLHGDRDRITPPKGSQHMAQAMARLGVDAQYVEIADEGHAFLRHPVAVDRRAAEWVVGRLLPADDGRETSGWAGTLPDHAEDSRSGRESSEVTPDAAPGPGRTS